MELTLPKAFRGRQFVGFRGTFRAALLAGAAAVVLTGCVSGPTRNAMAEASAPKVVSGMETIFGDYLAGRFAEQESDFAIAAELLDRVLEERPDDRVLAGRAFIANLSAGRYDRAAALAPRVVDQRGHQASTAVMVSAVNEIAKGDYASAIKLLNMSDRTGLSIYAVPLALAWAQAGEGHYDKAIAALDPLDDASGFATVRRLHRALIYKMAGELDKASKEIDLVDVDPAETPVRLIRAIARIRLADGNKAGAKSILEDYRTAHPDTIVVASDLKALDGTGSLEPLADGAAAGLADGLYHLAAGIRPQADGIALLYARMSNWLDPKNDLTLGLIGDIFDGRGRYRDAIAIYSQIPAGSPYSWEARLRIADGYIELEDDKAATSLLEQMVKERSDRTDALMKLGYLMRVREQYKKGAAYYTEAIDRLQDVRPEDWIMFYYRGITYERSKKWDRAEADFLKALELKPDDPFVLNYLGYSWIEQGVHIQKATAMIEKAVEQRQNDGYIVDSLGWALFKTGKYADAVKHLERAVQLKPQDPVITDHLGDAYWRVGRRTEARFQWDRALNLEPDKDLSVQLEDKLKNGLKEEPPLKAVE